MKLTQEQKQKAAAAAEKYSLEQQIVDANLEIASLKATLVAKEEEINTLKIKTPKTNGKAKGTGDAGPQ